MMNISLIDKIECKYRIADEYYIDISFMGGSAVYECKESKTPQGRSFKSTLTFNVPGITIDNRSIATRLRSARLLRFMDANGLWYVMGRRDIPPVVTVDEILSGTPGSFRGYRVTVEWESQTRPLTESFI